jgi:hypothetical protein
MVRAKFICVSVENGTVNMYPVTSGSKENERFYKYTPAGSLSLSTVNEEALAQFEQGKEYYIDISAA